MSVLAAVLTQIDHWWAAIFWPRLQGLTDEEFDWEPAPGTWTLSRAGTGTRFYEWPPGSQAEAEPPLTTISWRLAHVANGCLASRARQYFDRGAGVDAVGSFPGTATDALAYLAAAWQAWRSGLGSLDDEALWRPLGPGHPNDRMGLGADDPFLNMVMHNHRELMHHGAEINLLRDLWWALGLNEPLVVACLAADDAEVERLVAADPGVAERARRRSPALMVAAADRGAAAVRVAARLGFDANPAHRRSPLHAAVARGDRDSVVALVEAGADPDARDPQFNATARDWARFLGKSDLVEYLAAGAQGAGPADGER